MANFAQVNALNVVVNTIVIDDEVITDGNGQISEAMANDFGRIHVDPNCYFVIQTKTGTPHRNYGDLGHLWNAEINAFVPPQPYPSWSFDVNSLLWVAPVPLPDDGQEYRWDEPNQTWVIQPLVVRP